MFFIHIRALQHQKTAIRSSLRTVVHRGGKTFSKQFIAYFDLKPKQLWHKTVISYNIKILSSWVLSKIKEDMPVRTCNIPFPSSFCSPFSPVANFLSFGEPLLNSLRVDLCSPLSVPAELKDLLHLIKHADIIRAVIHLSLSQRNCRLPLWRQSLLFTFSYFTLCQLFSLVAA